MNLIGRSGQFWACAAWLAAIIRTGSSSRRTTSAISSSHRPAGLDAARFILRAYCDARETDRAPSRRMPLTAIVAGARFAGIVANHEPTQSAASGLDDGRA